MLKLVRHRKKGIGLDRSKYTDRGGSSSVFGTSFLSVKSLQTEKLHLSRSRISSKKFCYAQNSEISRTILLDKFSIFAQILTQITKIPNFNFCVIKIRVIIWNAINFTFQGLSISHEINLQRVVCNIDIVISFAWLVLKLDLILKVKWLKRVTVDWV